MSAFSDRLKELIRRRIAEGRYASQADVARVLGLDTKRFGHYRHCF